jgi:pilin isopeptide linkage protein
MTGSIFMTHPIFVGDGFSEKGCFMMGDSYPTDHFLGGDPFGPGDGFTFIIAAKDNQLGAAGLGKGYAGIDHSAAFIVQTHHSPRHPDGDSDVVPYVFYARNGSLTELVRFPQLPWYHNLYDKAGPFWWWLEYNPATTEFTLRLNIVDDRDSAVEMTVPDDFKNIGDQAYLGFTAGSGSAYQGIVLTEWYAAGAYVPGGVSGKEPVDVNPPSPPPINEAPGGYTIGYSADPGSGILVYQYSLDGPDGPWTAYDTPEGTHDLDKGTIIPFTGLPETVWARAVDVAGNLSGVTERTFTQDIPATGNISLSVVKNAVGGAPTAGLFTFGLYDSDGNLIATTTNDGTGRITFPYVHLDAEGEHDFTVREIGFNDGVWALDAGEIPVHVIATDDGSGEYSTLVSYPNKDSRFVNVNKNPGCALLEFPELVFDAPGVYEYTIKERPQSGEGWVTDDKEYRVIVTVTDDGNANLMATAEYPDGFPDFVDIYTGTPAKYVISACKMAVGAPLPDGQFSFGLFDSTDTLVATATNNAADETVIPEKRQLIDAARKRLRAVNGTTGEGVPIEGGGTSSRTLIMPAMQAGQARRQPCLGKLESVQRRLNDFQKQEVEYHGN